MKLPWGQRQKTDGREGDKVCAQRERRKESKEEGRGIKKKEGWVGEGMICMVGVLCPLASGESKGQR